MSRFPGDDVEGEMWIGACEWGSWCPDSEVPSFPGMQVEGDVTLKEKRGQSRHPYGWGPGKK
jgi:hypothetical protein